MQKVYIQSKNQFENIQWDTYKLSGDPENFFGDIAILVKTTYPNGNCIEGVAFLEAKRIYDDTNTFKKLDSTQLKRHLTFTHAHRTLFYDNININSSTNLEEQYYCKECYQDFNENYAATILTEQVLALNDKSREILKYSLPLSYILCTRYLNGFELDYSKNAVNLAKGYLDSNNRESVKYLFTIHTSEGDNFDPEPLDTGVNLN